MGAPRFLETAALDALVAQAQASPRRRLNLNLHAGPEAPCQRLAIALEPDSYIRPHRHLDPAKDETFLVLRGRIGALLFDAEGEVREARVLGPREAAFGVDVPSGCFHSFVALEAGSVFFEAKAGPYAPLGPEELAPWAPAEGSPEAPDFLEALRARLEARP